MSNKDVVRRMFDEVINNGNIGLIDELFDPDFQSETPTGVLDREGFKQCVIGWRAGFPDVHCDVADLVEEADRVAWSIRSIGTHTGDFMGIPATGKTMDLVSLNTGVFKDGRGYRHQMVMDTMKLMTQLGLMPEPAPTA